MPAVHQRGDSRGGRLAWLPSPGVSALATAKLVARATDGTGARQTEQFSLAQPNGASGWNSIEIKTA
jgi:hypothetical protein